MSAPPVASITNQRLADRLLADGRIGPEDHQRAISYATPRRTRVEEAIIDLDILSEADLLKHIATMHGTRFVSTEKLSKAAIPSSVIGKVSAKLADQHGMCPVLYDDASKVLSVVTADPDNFAALHEIKLAAGLRDVKPLVGRPAAVKAALDRHYRGNTKAFEALFKATQTMDMEVFAPNADAIERTAAAPRTAPVALNEPTYETFPGDVAAGAPGRAPTTLVAAQAPTGRAPPPATPLPPPAPVSIPPTSTPEFVEALNVLVSLLESSRQDLRGHSSTVARLVRKTCERIGLPPSTISAFVSASYLHDIGKMGAYHLTALNVAEYEGHRIAAMKNWELPGQLLHSVGLPAEVIVTMSSMYERFDGQGFPNGQSGKETPLGARILSVCDTYADLTQNPRNPYRKILRPFEACDVLANYRGTVFDPNIVDIFKQAMTGDDMRAKLLSDRHRALIVDTDPEETTVLELRLIEQGFEVKIARNAAQARRDLEGGEFAVVISEIDIDEPDAGLNLRAEVQREAFVRDVTWVILTSKTDRQSAHRAFDLGVDDFVSKPVSTDIFVAKVRQLIERRSAHAAPKGVSGSLAEMGLPDMVQILWHGRKTCALKIQGPNGSGEIHFQDGQIFHALWGALKGEDAFYKMLTLREGDFRLDPSFKPSTRTINVSPEGLLLEGMRRLDEGSLAAS